MYCRLDCAGLLPLARMVQATDEVAVLYEAVEGGNDDDHEARSLWFPFDQSLVSALVDR